MRRCFCPSAQFPMPVQADSRNPQSRRLAESAEWRRRAECHFSVQAPPTWRRPLLSWPHRADAHRPEPARSAVEKSAPERKQDWGQLRAQAKTTEKAPSGTSELHCRCPLILFAGGKCRHGFGVVNHRPEPAGESFHLSVVHLNRLDIIATGHSNPVLCAFQL